MRPTHEDYELVARRLDGEQVALTAAQRALAEEVAADESAVAPALEVVMPGGALQRVNARLTHVLRRPARRRAVWWAAAAAGAAVAACVLLVLLSERGVTPQPDEYVEQFLAPAAGQLEAQAVLLSEELAEYQVRLVLNEEWPVEMAVSGLEQELSEFMLSGTLPADELVWTGPEDPL